MRILILGNSDIFKKKIYFALKKFRKIKIELASRRNISKQIKINKRYSSYNKAINTTKAKIVYISLINSMHFKWALKSLNNNKHVIVDKPLTANFKDTKKLLNLARKKNLLLMESIVFHYHNQFKNIISKINLRKKTIITAKFHIPKLEKKNYRNFLKYDGGCFQDMSPYASYLIYIFFKNKNYLLNKQHIKNKNGLVNSFSISVKCKNITLNASYSFNSTYKNEIQIFNNNKKYSINYVFSPPINKPLTVEIFDYIKRKKYKVNFIKQNIFHAYFKEIFKIIRVKKYHSFYNEIEDIAKIKEKIS
jgi:NDP-hexose-3-ketoreductase